MIEWQETATFICKLIIYKDLCVYVIGSISSSHSKILVELHLASRVDHFIRARQMRLLDHDRGFFGLDFWTVFLGWILEIRFSNYID